MQNGNTNAARSVRTHSPNGVIAKRLEFMSDGLAVNSLADSISGYPLNKNRNDPLPIHSRNGRWVTKRTTDMVVFLTLITMTMIGFIVGVTWVDQNRAMAFVPYFPYGRPHFIFLAACRGCWSEL